MFKLVNPEGMSPNLIFIASSLNKDINKNKNINLEDKAFKVKVPDPKPKS